MTPSAVTVVVVNYRSSDLLRTGFAAFVGDPSPRVVVVDNHSTGAEAAAVARLADERGWTAVLSPTNDGFGAGVNRGVRAAFAAGARVVVLANPDLVVAPADVLALGARCTGSTAVSPRISRPDGRPWFVGAELDLGTGRTRSTPRPRQDGRTSPWLSGACVAFDRATWELGGGLAEDYFMYWEDVELGHRWSRRGIALVVADDIAAVHDPGGTQTGTHADTQTGTQTGTKTGTQGSAQSVTQGSGRRKSALYYRYNCRNRLRFAAQHLPPGLALRWVVGAPGYCLHVLLRGGRRQFLTHPGLVLAAARGTLEGMATVLAKVLTEGVRARRGGRSAGGGTSA